MLTKNESGGLARRNTGASRAHNSSRMGVARSTTSVVDRRRPTSLACSPGSTPWATRAPSREADLWAAILYAGPGAMLSHGTAAHWRGLIDYPPPTIEVSTPRKTKSISGVKVYARREFQRDFHDRLPVTSIAQTVLDLAASGRHQARPPRAREPRLPPRARSRRPPKRSAGTGRPGSKRSTRGAPSPPTPARVHQRAARGSLPRMVRTMEGPAPPLQHGRPRRHRRRVLAGRPASSSNSTATTTTHPRPSSDATSATT